MGGAVAPPVLIGIGLGAVVGAGLGGGAAEVAGAVGLGSEAGLVPELVPGAGAASLALAATTGGGVVSARARVIATAVSLSSCLCK